MDKSELKRRIAYHDDLYHNKARPEISDEAYDALKKQLEKFEEEDISVP